MADNPLSTFLPDRAATGFFPQMKPRRRFQDREGSANVPLDVMRGRLAGMLGTPTDLANLLKSPMPTEMFGETNYEPAQQLPYGSEYFLKNLPLAPTSRVGEVAGQAGSFVPLNPMPTARAAAAGVKALGPTAGRMAEGYLQRQGLMPNIVPEAPQVPLGSMIEKPQAPVSPLGFYSAAEQAALNIPRKSGTGESFLNDLMKGQDVKKDELSWLGLDDYLKGKPNVTRQEVQDFISSNRVDVQERQLGAAVAEDPVGIAQRKAVFDKYEPQIQALYKDMDSFGYDTPPAVLQSTDNRLRKLQEMRDAEADAFYKIPEPTPTTYQKYQLPGGENYREILLTLPARMDTAGWSAQKSGSGWLVFDETGAQRGSNYTATTANNAIAEMASERAGKSYTSSHFDQPNILAHMRVNDRVDADGKKMLLIEEIQSDWHQAGREKGYKTGKERNPAQVEKELTITTQKRSRLLEEAAALPDSEMTKFKTMNEEIKKLSEQATKLNEEWTNLLNKPEGVPDAPFKDTWHQLALKRALKYAADNGYDRVGLTTGRQQVDRYANEIRQNVDEIVFEKSAVNFPVKLDTPNIQITASKNGKETFSGAVSRGKFIDGPAAGKTVEEVLGKSMAKQIAEHKQDVGSIKGDDLTIGGEGMKTYYDEIYPAFLAKQGKKYNAKTGETRIKTGQGIPGGAPVRYIDISPEMRGGVKKGQPLFTAAPIGGIGVGAGMQDQQQNSLKSFIK
jgi:hypothetical protein